MAHFRRPPESFSPSRTLAIVGSEFVDDHTVYNIQVGVGLFKWCVRHRYSDFYALHEKLMRQFPRLDWSLLPKKKLFGSQSEQFILKRQSELETYLRLLLQSLPSISSDLMKFLDFHKYEVHGITELLTETLYDLGDSILASDKLYHMSPLQLYAICTRLALPEPTCESKDVRKDIGHLLDFVTRLKCLQINGSTLPVGRSNINMNDLAFDLHCFKSLTSLHISGCNIEKISDIEHLKKTLMDITVSHSLSALKEFLLLGIGRGQLTMCDANTATLLVQPWSSVRRASFSHNRISHVDESVKLLRNVELLDLSHNRLDTIDNLQHLSCLRTVILAHNVIRQVPLLHTKLGNVTQIDISNNKLETLEGLAKLYSLEVLDVSHNNITQIQDVKFVGGLPCLELLILCDNPVTGVLDYRMAVFEIFAERAREICLDGIKPTEQEIELVAVRSALNKSREQKRTAQKTSRKVNEPTIADASDSPELSASPAASASRSYSNSNPDRTVSAETPSHENLPVVHPPPAVFPGETASASDAVTLHQKIVHLKETGGTCWLRQLNDLLHSEGHSPLDQALKTSCDVPSELPHPNLVDHRAGPASFPLGHLKRTPRKVHESESASKDDCESSRKTNKPANIMLPETLPSAADGAVCSYLQSLLPSKSHKAADAAEQFQELPIHIMWCTAMIHHTTKQAVEFPACVFVTTENVHVFGVRSLAGDTGVPELSRTMRLPLEKVTQIAVGYESLYIQLEWAATEPRTHGLVVFLTFSHGKSNAFINAIKLARRRATPELDEYEDPHIVPGSGLEASLKQALVFYERCSDLDGVHVLLYLLVMVEGRSPDSVKTSSLVVTSRYVYLIGQDYCNTPLPSFTKALPSGPAYEVVSIFPVSSRLVNIQMYDVDTIESSSCHSLWSAFGKTGSDKVPSVGFIGYGVRMSFHLGEYGIQVLDVRMPTSNQRERFLSTVVKVHASVSDVLARTSSLQRIKTPSPMRDADSLSCGSCGSQRSSSQPKWKKGKKKPTEVLNPIQTAQESGIGSAREKHQISSDNTTRDLRPSGNLDRGDSEISNSVVTTAEVSSLSTSHLPNGKFDSLVNSEKTDLVSTQPGPDDTEQIRSTTFEPHVGGDNPTLSSTDNEPLPVISFDGKFSEKDSNGHDSSSCDRISVHDDEIEQDESMSKTILYDSEVLQDLVSFGKSHDGPGPQKNTSLSSAGSSDEESSYEDAPKQGHCEENTLTDTQIVVSDSDIAVVRLSVGEVGSTNRRSSVNSASKNYSSLHPAAVNDMTLHLDKEKGRSFVGNSETAPLPLHFGYPSNELLLHLAEHFEAVALFPPVSPQFEAFMSLSSLELVNYFHQNIAIISMENEELSHVLWSFVVPYANPSVEIPSCVLLSTKAVYFASDHCEHKHTPSLRSHKRCFSDTSPLQPSSNDEFDERSSKCSPCHLSCGILNNSAYSEQKRVFRVYGTIMLKDLKQVNIGIFSQSIRLTGPGEESVYSCVTRDCQASEMFLHRLKGILTKFYPLPSPETNIQDLEQDFYSMFSKPKPESKFTDDGRFVYPLDDSIADTLFLIRRSLKGDKANATGIRILSYLLCFQLDSDLSSEVQLDLLHGKPRTLILTEEQLVLAAEDHVSYPLPDFTRTPPARPQMEIAEVRSLDYLQQVALRSDDVHALVLVFSDETSELVVDTSIEHFGSDREQTPQKLPQKHQEVRWTLLIQNVNGKDKLIRLISQQWEEQHGGRQLAITTLP